MSSPGEGLSFLGASLCPPPKAGGQSTRAEGSSTMPTLWTWNGFLGRMNERVGQWKENDLGNASKHFVVGMFLHCWLTAAPGNLEGCSKECKR